MDFLDKKLLQKQVAIDLTFRDSQEIEITSKAKDCQCNKVDSMRPTGLDFLQ